MADNECIQHVHKYHAVMDLPSCNTARDFIMKGLADDVDMCSILYEDREYYLLFLDNVKQALDALALLAKRYKNGSN